MGDNYEIRISVKHFGQGNLAPGVTPSGLKSRVLHPGQLMVSTDERQCLQILASFATYSAQWGHRLLFLRSFFLSNSL